MERGTLLDGLQGRWGSALILIFASVRESVVTVGLCLASTIPGSGGTQASATFAAAGELWAALGGTAGCAGSLLRRAQPGLHLQVLSARGWGATGGPGARAQLVGRTLPALPGLGMGSGGNGGPSPS